MARLLLSALAMFVLTLPATSQAGPLILLTENTVGMNGFDAATPETSANTGPEVGAVIFEDGDVPTGATVTYDLWYDVTVGLQLNFAVAAGSTVTAISTPFATTHGGSDSNQGQVWNTAGGGLNFVATGSNGFACAGNMGYVGFPYLPSGNCNPNGVMDGSGVSIDRRG